MSDMRRALITLFIKVTDFLAIALLVLPVGLSGCPVRRDNEVPRFIFGAAVVPTFPCLESLIL